MQRKLSPVMTLYASSLIRLFRITPRLQALNLSGQEVIDDYFVLETGDSVSAASYPIPSYLTKEYCNCERLLEELLNSCPNLICLNLSFCSWVTTDMISLFCERDHAIRSLNLVGCRQLQPNLACLFYFTNSSKLKEKISSLIAQ
jgi:hypothetical protein